MTSKNSKRALISSALAIVLCVAMLIGTTFAWFTSTASTGVAPITTGNLYVKIQDENNSPVENLTWKTQNGTALGEDGTPLWEPGCTYTLTPFKIVNTGTLALKYKIVIDGLTAGDSELLDVIKFTYTTEDGAFDMNEEGHLTAAGTDGASTKLITVTAKMDETAGNDYQNKKLEGVKFTVYATQDTVEYDSKDNRYDKNATYSVADFASLQKSFEGSGIYNVTADINVEDTLTLTDFNALTLNATGKTISNTTDLWNEDTNSWSLVSARGSSYLTITGGNFDAKENDCYAVDVQDGATVVIKDGTFIGNISAVYVFKGTARIEGGFFDIQQLNDNNVQDGYGLLLNCYDANRKAGTAKIIVTGGTFVNFNPADNHAEGADTNFVPDGYKVISEAHGSDTWYTVVKG